MNITLLSNNYYTAFNITPHNEDVEADSSFRQLAYTNMDYIMMTAYCIVFIVGIGGNSCVLSMFRLRNQKMAHLQKLLMYLATFDLIASITNPLFFIYLHVSHFNQWDFGDLGCKLIPGIWKISITMSIGIIMLINVDRCIAIQWPFRPKLKNIGKPGFQIPPCQFLTPE